jgi:hypothetical protein
VGRAHGVKYYTKAKLKPLALVWWRNMKIGNLVRVKQVPGQDAAGNPLQEHLAVYLGENTYCEFEEPVTVYDVLMLGETKPYQISSNLWELEKI